MDIYFDFEATQFSERIIAIGATCEYGDFECLISSFSKKITPFITELTGITQEMVIGAPTAEEAFIDLRNWINEIALENEVINYHCYGNCDKNFLRNTARKVDNSEIADYINMLANTIIDDSLYVNYQLGVNGIGVHKALKSFKPEIPEQDHDALNDAILLYELMKFIDVNVVIPVVVKKKKKKKKAPITNTPKTYKIVVKHIFDKGAKPRTFNNYELAAMWIYQKIKHRCPDVKYENVRKNVIKAIDTGTSYSCWRWEKIK